MTLFATARAIIGAATIIVAPATLAPTPLFAQVAPAPIPTRPPDRVIQGAITRADHQSYKDAPFEVPTGTMRLVVAFDYDTRDQKTVIDLGLRDQHGFRGASGGNKASFTIAESDATPSYLPGRIDPGIWHLSLAVPNIRTGVTAHWTAKIWFLKAPEASSLPATVIDRGPGWYRGDLHLHTAHSDGSCESQSGKRVPCPLFLTLETAAARGLDFVAVTEHNTISHLNALREDQPYFDRMLLIPGREITTFYGHFNIFGVTEPIDYRIVPNGTVTFNSIADRVHKLGGIVSINHPALPSGEACMGCGWTMAGVDLARADAIEVANGGTIAALGGRADGPWSGIPFWLDALAGSHPVTAIGGSDNHEGTARKEIGGTVGRPTTVVYADGLSQAHILTGIARGRVFVDIAGDRQSLLDLHLRSSNASASMGGLLRRRAGEPLVALIDAKASPGSRVELLAGKDIVVTRALTEGPHVEVPIDLPPGRAIVRIVVRAVDDRLLLLGNAIRVDTAR
ncbi:CehA/McbA family metallohydrolase [Sphingomonas sp. ERG5]|uniref:CehA/McbA family metallohydrolase n=1 Tax=Sphingomonas sp. ERG5 TaxID=1381597 RepID=UPI00068CA093|nr:CehA/McbA family metallohydrolase [Sphingomonas sp. ERG5]